MPWPAPRTSWPRSSPRTPRPWAPCAPSRDATGSWPRSPWGSRTRPSRPARRKAWGASRVTGCWPPTAARRRGRCACGCAWMATRPEAGWNGGSLRDAAPGRSRSAPPSPTATGASSPPRWSARCAPSSPSGPKPRPSASSPATPRRSCASGRCGARASSPWTPATAPAASWRCWTSTASCWTTAPSTPRRRGARWPRPSACWPSWRTATTSTWWSSATAPPAARPRRWWRASSRGSTAPWAAPWSTRPARRCTPPRPWPPRSTPTWTSPPAGRSAWGAGCKTLWQSW